MIAADAGMSAWEDAMTQRADGMMGPDDKADLKVGLYGFLNNEGHEEHEGSNVS